MSNPFRTTYRQLTDAEKARVEALKTQAEQLLALIDKPSREGALARTKLEECVMWAVKGITG
jgi:hypothetical protein